MLQNFKNLLHRAFPDRGAMPIRQTISKSKHQCLQAIGITDFLKLDVPAREMLLSPILPERSLGMLYAPRGVGKSWLGLSMGLAIAAGESLLRWSSPRPRNVLYIDGEMPLVSLQERLREISVGMGSSIPNDRFRILAADNVDGGINLSTEQGQEALEPLLESIDLLILDNLSTLLTSRSESASDAWVPMQNWLLGLRRQGKSVLLIHHPSCAPPMSRILRTTAVGTAGRSLPTEPEGKPGSILAHGPPCSFLERQRSDLLVSLRDDIAVRSVRKCLIVQRIADWALVLGRTNVGRVIQCE